MFNWINSNGDRIESIQDYLNENHTTDDLNEQGYFAYIYKEAPRQAGGKSYTKVHHKMYKSRAGNDKKLQEDIKPADPVTENILPPNPMDVLFTHIDSV